MPDVEGPKTSENHERRSGGAGPVAALSRLWASLGDRSGRFRAGVVAGGVGLLVVTWPLPVLLAGLLAAWELWVRGGGRWLNRALPVLLVVFAASWAQALDTGDEAPSPAVSRSVPAGGPAAVPPPPGTAAPATAATAPTPPGAITTTVTRIVDGDTLHVAHGEERVRLIGIDTPEVSGGDECFGAQATAHAAELVPVGTEVVLRLDVEERDRYGRLLAYVWRSADGLFLNDAMVRDGYASVYTVPPNVAHQDLFLAAEREAREGGRGLWSACTATTAPPAPAVAPVPPPPAPAAVAPAAPSSPCHPSYTGACVPVASDVDCAGGSGNGPAYVRGPVTVIGPDEYGLDRDGDGTACE